MSGGSDVRDQKLKAATKFTAAQREFRSTDVSAQLTSSNFDGYLQKYLMGNIFRS